MHSKTAKVTGLTRRRLLQTFGALSVTAAIGEVSGLRPAGSGGHLGDLALIGATDVGVRWSDPSSWPSGRVPGAKDRVVVSKPMVLDASAVVGSLLIEATGSLTFTSLATTTLESKGNVEVQGRLTMRPANLSVRHMLRFTDIDESRFIGGGRKVLASDPGLWVVGAGILDLAGASKRPWTRASSDLHAGASKVRVDDATGWMVGDVVAIAPTTPPTPDNDKITQDVDHCLTYDEGTIAGIDGRTITLKEPLSHSHNRVTLTDWSGVRKTYGAEVMNLSRNVVIEGTPTGRTHIAFIAVAAPQAMSHVEVRHVGPRKVVGTSTESVLGRYGVHFHQSGDATRGTVLEGVVVHSCGGHAFVPHDSHGITLRECVAHDVQDTAFWWDLHDRDSTYFPATNDALWDRCLASQVWATEKAAEGYRMAGFYLGEGEDGSNACIGCVAVGVRDHDSTMNSSMVSGFHWPERGKAIWQFRDCLAHNVGGSGILTWQNDEHVHLIERFTAYHGGKSGIDHGAYANFWHFRDCVLHANRRAGLAIHAVTRRTNATPDGSPPLRFENMIISGGGITHWGVHSEGHRFPAPDIDPVVVYRANVHGCKRAAYFEQPNNNRTNLRMVDCTVDGLEFYFDDAVSLETLVGVENLNSSGDRFVLRSKDQPGILVRPWNARRS